ncbi:hypothetical protein GP486_008112, partial [Trichoglossum hirsutum]
MPGLLSQRVSKAPYNLSRNLFRNSISTPLCCSPQCMFSALRGKKALGLRKSQNTPAQFIWRWQIRILLVLTLVAASVPSLLGDPASLYLSSRTNKPQGLSRVYLATRSATLSPVLSAIPLRANEAIKNGNFVDIHDIGGTDPKDYDVLITDVDNDVLRSEISELVGMPYLKEATKDEANNTPDKTCGFVYGQKFRMIFPCLLSIKDKAHWVRVDIYRLPHTVHLTPPKSHFKGINILGSDFCILNRLRPWINDNDRTVTYYIGWKFPKKG